MALYPARGPYDEDEYEDTQSFYDDPPHIEQHYQTPTPPPPPPPAHRIHPAAHPSSSFGHLQNQRQYGMAGSGQAPQGSPPRSIMTQGHQVAPQRPPQYEQTFGGAQDPQRRLSYTTPASDNFSNAAAGGGIAGIAYDVSDQHARESGVQALRDIDNLYRRPSPPENPFENASASSLPSTPGTGPYGHGAVGPGQTAPHANYPRQNAYQDEITPIAGPSYSPERPNPYHQQQAWYDNPYQAHSISRAPAGINDIDPNAIADDGDDGLWYGAQHPKRRSILPFGHNSNGSRSRLEGAAAGGAAGAAAGAFAAGTAMPHPQAGGIFGSPGNRDPSGTYAAVPGGAANAPAGSGAEPGAAKEMSSEWLASQTKGNKKLKWIVGSVIAVIILLAAAGGAVGGVLSSRKHSSSSSSTGGSQGESAAQDDGSGDLGPDSPEIEALMNNKNLHRVFPGIDYTPINTQYPACLTNPPSQNNVTRDMAVLSQLTNTLRLYGTDCNQTEMVLHSIQRLGLTDMKVWLGVWLSNNQTTNNRQLSDMWMLLDKYTADPFAGLAIGNEVLFRQDMTAAALGEVLTSVKQNLTDHSIDLPVATSDLGSNWNEALAAEVDVVMANVHPFFAGVTAEVAASWTWSFWQENDVAVSSGKKNIISETGWPGGGGNDCGTGNTCPNSAAGSVAGIDEMNQFMNDWVCQSLANGTDYFWFEAFDEPWKIEFNTPSKGENWEDKWGLMDVNRNLKDGVQIPDCGGKTVSRR